jgi:arginase family enzyme
VDQPRAVAPGVSAPAGLGVPAHVILAACQAAAASGKLRHADVYLAGEFDRELAASGLTGSALPR